jgi:CRISPR-associated exonuclease Cas4
MDLPYLGGRSPGGRPGDLMVMWWLATFLLVIVGGMLVATSRRWQAEAGMPGGRVVSVDLERDGRAAPPMIDERLGLSGRPDLLLETRGGWVPVEIKSGQAPATPYLSHVLQLAAYCRLAEVTYGRRPLYGIVQYADRGYSLPYTRALEANLLRGVERIRAEADRLPGRSHSEVARCAACGYSSACDQRLASPQGGEGSWL